MIDPQLAEYHKDQNIEELADLLEVINAVTIARGYSLQELEQVCEEKATKRGGFALPVILLYAYTSTHKNRQFRCHGRFIKRNNLPS